MRRVRLKTLRADSITHVAISGRLDVQGVSELQYEFLDLLTTQPKPSLVDISQMTYVASLGIGMLVSAAKHLERHGARLVLLAPTDMVRKTIETSGLSHMIRIAADERAALELLEEPEA